MSGKIVGMTRRAWEEDDDDSVGLLELARRLREFLTAPFPADATAHDRQGAEMWALEQFARLRAEVREEEKAQRRSFIQGQVCAYLTEGYSRSAAAQAAGVTPETVSRWCRKYPAFAAAARSAEAERRQSQPQRRRRQKMTEGVQSAIVSLLEEGRTRGQAAVAAGISRQTFYTWFQRLPEFREAVLVAEDAAAARLPGGAK